MRLDTPHYKGYAEVGLVPNIAADVILVIEVLDNKTVLSARRAQRNGMETEDKVDVDDESTGSDYDVDIEARR